MVGQRQIVLLVPGLDLYVCVVDLTDERQQRLLVHLALGAEAPVEQVDRLLASHAVRILRVLQIELPHPEAGQKLLQRVV